MLIEGYLTQLLAVHQLTFLDLIVDDNVDLKSLVVFTLHWVRAHHQSGGVLAKVSHLLLKVIGHWRAGEC